MIVKLVDLEHIFLKGWALQAAQQGSTQENRSFSCVETHDIWHNMYM